MLKLGTQNISALYVGGAKIKRALVGTEVVFEDNPAYTVYFYAIEGTDTSKVLNSSSWTVNPGESVTVYPWTISGYLFDGWYEGDTLLSSATGAFVYTPTKPSTTIYLRYVVAYTLSVNVGSGIAGVSVLLNGTAVPNPQLSRSYTFKAGTQITLEGKDFPSGWQFSHWYNDWTSFSYTNPWTFTMPSKNVGISLEGKKASRLPEGYTEVEYISPPDSTYNYGGVPLHANNVNFGTNTTIKVVFMPSGTAYSIVWRSANGYNILSMSSETKVTLSALSNTSYASNSAVSLLNQKVTFTAMYSSQLFGIAAGTYANAFDLKRGTLTGNTIIYLGNTSATGKCCTGRYYSAEISNGSTKIANCVPCVASNGDVGMFNLISNTFHKAINYGNYKWTAGPAV